MSPFTPPHVATVNRLNRLFVRQLGDRAIVSVQNSMRLDDGTEPEPDVVLLRPDTPETRLPIAGDVLLVVEVAETTEAFDRGVKLTRYAAAGIPEVWLVLPTRRRAEVYRGPGPGGYDETRVLDRDGDLPIGALPDATPFRLADVLPELADASGA